MKDGTPNWNPLLGERARLLILAKLAAAGEAIEFTELVEELGLTKGNLSAHLRRLEEAQLIEMQKEFVDRKPRTTYWLTKLGRTELKTYLAGVEELLGAVKKR